MIIAAQHFAFLLIFLIITFITGTVAIRFFTKRIIPGFFLNLYASLLTGNLILVTAYAIARTSGKTILILALPLLAYFVHIFRTNNALTQKKPTQERTTYFSAFSKSLLTLPVLIFLFLLEFLFLFDFQNKSFLPQTTPFSYYSYVSEYIASSGQENPYHVFNYLDPDYQGVAPYHYFELWTNAIINFTFNGLSVVNLLTITFPFFYFTTFIGILAIIEKYKKHLTLLDIGFGIVLLFVAGIYFSFYNDIHFLRSGAEYSKILAFGENRKLASIFAFIPAIFLFFLFKKYKYILVFCLILPLHNVILFPPIIGGIILILLINFFYRREKVLLEILMLVFFIGLFGSFYTVFASDLNVNQNESLKVLTQLFDLSKLKTRFNIIAGSIIYTLVAFLPFIILIIAIFRLQPLQVLKVYKLLFIFFLLISFSGLVTWALLFEMIDSNQFFTQIHGILFNFSIIFLLIHLTYNSAFTFRQKRLAIPALFLLLGILSAYNIYRVILANTHSTHYGKTNFDKRYLKQITALVQEGKIAGVGGYIKNAEEFSGAVAPLNALFSLKGMYFPVIKPELVAISLDYTFPEKEDQLTRDREKRILLYSGFLRYVEKQKSAGEFKDFEQSQVDFIKEKNLKFIILSKGISPSPKLQLLTEQAITDPASGETILILKG